MIIGKPQDHGPHFTMITTPGFMSNYIKPDFVLTSNDDNRLYVTLNNNKVIIILNELQRNNFCK